MKNYLEYLDAKIEKKNTVKGLFISTNCVLAAVFGALCWGVVKLFFGGNIIGLLCTMGYFVCFVGILGSILYLMNRDRW